MGGGGEGGREGGGGARADKITFFPGGKPRKCTSETSLSGRNQFTIVRLDSIKNFYRRLG